VVNSFLTKKTEKYVQMRKLWQAGLAGRSSEAQRQMRTGALVACLAVAAIGTTVLVRGASAQSPIPFNPFDRSVRCSGDEWEAVQTKFLPSLQRFQDSAERAGRTSRTDLAPVVVDMQRQRRSSESFKSPECFVGTQTAIVKAMDDTISTVLAFMGEGSEAALSRPSGTTKNDWDRVAVLIDSSKPR
jgi:hypothetical protein